MTEKKNEEGDIASKSGIVNRCPEAQSKPYKYPSSSNSMKTRRAWEHQKQKERMCSHLSALTEVLLFIPLPSGFVHTTHDLGAILALIFLPILVDVSLALYHM